MYSVGFTRYDLEPQEESLAMRLFPMEYETVRKNQPKLLRTSQSWSFR